MKLSTLVNPLWIFACPLNLQVLHSWSRVSQPGSETKKKTFFSTPNNMRLKPPKAKILKVPKSSKKKSRSTNSDLFRCCIHTKAFIVPCKSCKWDWTDQRGSALPCNLLFKKKDQKNRQKHLESFTGSSLKAYNRCFFHFFYYEFSVYNFMVALTCDPKSLRSMMMVNSVGDLSVKASPTSPRHHPFAFRRHLPPFSGLSARPVKERTGQMRNPLGNLWGSDPPWNGPGYLGQLRVITCNLPSGQSKVATKHPACLWTRKHFYLSLAILTLVVCRIPCLLGSWVKNPSCNSGIVPLGVIPLPWYFSMDFIQGLWKQTKLRQLGGCFSKQNV